MNKPHNYFKFFIFVFAPFLLFQNLFSQDKILNCPYIFLNNLQLGNKNEEVRLLNKILEFQILGNQKQAFTENSFDKSTEKFLRKFQEINFKDKNLVDGKFNEKTRELINKKCNPASTNSLPKNISAENNFQQQNQTKQNQNPSQNPNSEYSTLLNSLLRSSGFGKTNQNNSSQQSSFQNPGPAFQFPFSPPAAGPASAPRPEAAPDQTRPKHNEDKSASPPPADASAGTVNADEPIYVPSQQQTAQRISENNEIFSGNSGNYWDSSYFKNFKTDPFAPPPPATLGKDSGDQDNTSTKKKSIFSFDNENFWNFGNKKTGFETGPETLRGDKTSPTAQSPKNNFGDSVNTTLDGKTIETKIVTKSEPNKNYSTSDIDTFLAEIDGDQKILPKSFDDLRNEYDECRRNASLWKRFFTNPCPTELLALSKQQEEENKNKKVADDKKAENTSASGSAYKIIETDDDLVGKLAGACYDGMTTLFNPTSKTQIGFIKKENYTILKVQNLVNTNEIFHLYSEKNVSKDKSGNTNSPANFENLKKGRKGQCFILTNSEKKLENTRCCNQAAETFGTTLKNECLPNKISTTTNYKLVSTAMKITFVYCDNSKTQNK